MGAESRRRGWERWEGENEEASEMGAQAKGREGRKDGKRAPASSPPSQSRSSKTHVISHEQVVGVWRVSSDTKELREIVLGDETRTRSEEGGRGREERQSALARGTRSPSSHTSLF